MSLLYDAVKSIALDYDLNRIAAGILFGTVKKTDPLEIEIDQKLILTEKFLTVAQHLSEYSIDSNLLTEQINGFVAIHDDEHKIEVKPGEQNGAITLKNKLLKGQRVILARMEGGHQYVVLDRIADA